MHLTLRGIGEYKNLESALNLPNICVYTNVPADN